MFYCEIIRLCLDEVFHHAWIVQFCKTWWQNLLWISEFQNKFIETSIGTWSINTNLAKRDTNTKKLGQTQITRIQMVTSNPHRFIPARIHPSVFLAPGMHTNQTITSYSSLSFYHLDTSIQPSKYRSTVICINGQRIQEFTQHDS